jgi:hypothetical protein
MRFFRRAFLIELHKVAALYTGAQFEVVETGLIVKPGRPHITRQ